MKQNVSKLIVATLILTTALSPVSNSAYAAAAGNNAGGNGNGNAYGVHKNEQIVADDKSALTDAVLLNGNDSLAAVTRNLTLPERGANGSKIAWSSANPSLVSSDGIVKRPAFQAGDATVTLTATLKKGNATDTKTVQVTVAKQAPTDAEAVAAAQAALSIGYAQGDTETSVTADLTLPTAGAFGTTIAWSSDMTDVVAADGNVVRPEIGGGNKTVTLTATLTRGGETLTKPFTVTVIERVPVQVQLLSINDLHGKIDQTYSEDLNGDKINESIGRIDYLATYLRERQAQNPNTLTVHAGDAVGGSSPVSALFQDEPTVEALEAIGFDAGTIGNHELDEGTQEMLRLNRGGDHPNGTPNYDGINFPLVAANVVYKDTKQPVLDRYTVQEVGGVKIGFIGVVTRSAAGMVMPEGIQDIEFTDETAAVNEAAAELKEQGVKSIVVLAHMDASQSGATVTGPAATLAQNVDDEVDVILAAHNHQKVNGIVDNKLVVQAYEYGKAFADIDLEIDPVTQDIIKKTAEVVPVNQANVTPDPAVRSILDKYTQAIQPILNERVGVAAVAMEGGYTNTGDNALGNLIADSMAAGMNSDFAMMNGGGIRDKLNQGEITWGELFNILPFNNILTRVEILGSDLPQIIDAQLSTRYGPDFSIAGFKYSYNLATGKVVAITLPDGTPIDPNKTYTLTVNNFMATSTSAKYAPIGQLGKNPTTGPEDLEALVNYVKNDQGELNYQAEGRIAYSNRITATNNRGASDTVTVTDLGAGNIVKVYANTTDLTPLAQATVAEGSNTATVAGLNLGVSAGSVYVTNTVIDARGYKTEGPRLPISFTEEVEQTYTSIATAKGQSGQSVTVKGIVTADNAAIGGGKLSTYVQDVTGGINVFNVSASGFPNLVAGDEVEITGTIDVYNGLTEIKPSAGGVIVLAQGKQLPAAQATTLEALSNAATAEPLEGQLVNVKAYVSDEPDTPVGGGYNVTLIDADFNSTILRVPAGTDVIGTLETGKWYDITAILSQYDSYQLIPRQAADIALAAEQPAAPSTSGVTVEAEVLRGVDGDTVKLAAPVFGATNVRFLNIDTPETNYEGKSQGYHGEEAKHKLAELLTPGTKITLTFGQEPKDKYGRLLAVVKKGDLDINRELLRLGLASTYFIYPNIDNIADYGAAMQEAIDNQRGIWNPANPLTELPFLFRAGTSPLTKPVGDITTHQYVAPDLWAQVPVQNRVFFFTEADRIAAGYTERVFSPSDATVISPYYHVNSTALTITGVPYGTKVEMFHKLLTPAFGASVQVVDANGSAVTTVADGNRLIVTAQDGTEQTYAITVNEATEPDPQPEPEPVPTGTHAVINEVYGGGGNSGAVYKNDFIELYNPTDAAINLDGWSVQYAAASATGAFSNSYLTQLSGTIQAHGYYLIQLAGGSNGVDLPGANLTGTVNLAATSGKVALVRNKTTGISGLLDPAVVDFVGYGTANLFEGTGAAPTITNSTSAQRKVLGADADDNANDFVKLAPTPLN